MAAEIAPRPHPVPSRRRCTDAGSFPSGRAALVHGGARGQLVGIHPKCLRSSRFHWFAGSDGRSNAMPTQ
jgi:hypothetical protein